MVGPDHLAPPRELGRLARWFPGTAARYYLSRARAVEAARLYDMATAKYADRFAPLLGKGYGADGVMAHGGQALVDWARYLDENSDIAIGVLDTLIDQVATVEPEPTVIDDSKRPITAMNDTLHELWQQWTRGADVARVYPWSELKRLIARAWLRDGEAFTRLLAGNVRGVEHVSPVPLAVQHLEADYCPRWLTDELTGAIQGVRLNRWGRPTGYHLYRRHPGGVLPYLGIGAREDLVLTPPDGLIHVKHVRRAQVRGVSIFAGTTARIMDIKSYDESERLAARIASSFAAVIKRAAPFGGTPRYTSGGKRAMQIEDGMIMDMLAPGEELQIVSSQRPNAQFEPFRASQLKGVAAGTRASYSTISKDYSGTYSSQRQALVEQRPAYDGLRTYWVAAWLDPVYRRFVDLAIAAGAIDPAGLMPEQLYRANYSGAVTPWIDPLKEVQADALAVRHGFKSRYQVMRERGYDPRRVDRERDLDDFEQPDPGMNPAADPAEEKETDDAAA